MRSCHSCAQNSRRPLITFRIRVGWPGPLLPLWPLPHCPKLAHCILCWPPCCSSKQACCSRTWHTPQGLRAGPFSVFSLCSMITSSVRPSPLFYTILHHKTLFVMDQILTSPRRMFFKYQFGKQYVYEMDVSTPDNLKIFLKNGTVLYFLSNSTFLQEFFFNKNTVLFLI